MIVPIVTQVDVSIMGDEVVIPISHENMMAPTVKRELRVVFVDTNDGHARDYKFGAARLTQAADYYPVGPDDIAHLREMHQEIGDYLKGEGVSTKERVKVHPAHKFDDVGSCKECGWTYKDLSNNRYVGCYPTTSGCHPDEALAFVAEIVEEMESRYPETLIARRILETLNSIRWPETQR